MFPVWKLQTDWPCSKHGARIPFVFRSAKLLLNTKFSAFWNRNPVFQWLLLVLIEKFLLSLVASPLSCSLPLCYTFCDAYHAELLASGAKTAFRPFMNCAQLWDSRKPADRILKTTYTLGPIKVTNIQYLRFSRQLKKMVRNVEYFITYWHLPKIVKRKYAEIKEVFFIRD